MYFLGFLLLNRSLMMLLMRFSHLCFPLQVITLEGWVDIMYYVMDAHSFYNFIYFILLIIVSMGRDRGLSPQVNP